MLRLALILILVVFLLRTINSPISIYVNKFSFFVKNFTPKFRSTGRAVLYTILIDRPIVNSSRAYSLIRRLKTTYEQQQLPLISHGCIQQQQTKYYRKIHMQCLRGKARKHSISCLNTVY